MYGEIKIANGILVCIKKILASKIDAKKKWKINKNKDIAADNVCKNL